MKINELLAQRNMTRYSLARESHVPYSTLNDICKGKTDLAKCTAETVYRLAQTLQVTMEELLAPCMEERCPFELFKSNVCHQLKENGDINFLIDTLESNSIMGYYEKGWYAECLYLLAMVDYISRENDIPLCEEYDDLRKMKLSKLIYPAGILAICAAAQNQSAKEEARKEAIPEFLRFNIIESEVRNVT